MDRRLRIAVLTAAASAALGLAPPAGAGAVPSQVVPYEATAGPVVPTPVFAIRYTGRSRTQTTYRGTPPNPGGDGDLNTARDEGHARWALTYPAGLVIPACTGAPDDPCASVTGPRVADGRTSASGRIDHRHVDGLYRQLDAVDRCDVRAKAVPRRGLEARIDVVHDPARGAFVVTARSPLALTLQLLPPNCLSRPDGIDRILGNYFMPGFSFSPEYGEGRWFTAASFAIPDEVWRSSTRIRLRPGLTAQGRPPKDCAARFQYERCRTSGSWSGVLTFTRR